MGFVLTQRTLVAAPFLIMVLSVLPSRKAFCLSRIACDARYRSVLTASTIVPVQGSSLAFSSLPMDGADGETKVAPQSSSSEFSSFPLDGTDGETAAAQTTLLSSPWSDPAVQIRVTAKQQKNNNARFRQHVNPLARQYQKPTVLPDRWPSSAFTDMSKPIHLDIGCGKGGFLIDLCKADTDTDDSSCSSFNYLGLELRPGVAAYAKERIATHQLQGRLDFLGCNANIDLDRVLSLYQNEQCPSTTSITNGCLQRVSIQFPNPHFKTQYLKRHVVTPNLVDSLAKYMPAAATVFLQSDVKSKSAKISRCL